MKRFVLPLLLAFSPLAALACDRVELPEPVAAEPVLPAAPADEPVLISAAAAEDASARGCVRDTGTRTPSRDEDGCNGLPGESYDKEQIDRTGAVDTADAIRRLSPSATIRH